MVTVNHRMTNFAHQHDEIGESTFASTLRRRRKFLSLSLAEVSDRVGCAKSYLSSIENGHKGPPTHAIVLKLEQALSFQNQELQTSARWDQTPPVIRKDLEKLQIRDRSARTLAELLSQNAQKGASLDELYASGELQRLIDGIRDEQTESDRLNDQAADKTTKASSAFQAMSDQLTELPMQVPILNKVTAGYPAEFTDMGYPAGVADDYVRTPDLNDPDAFAARVVGDSMEPAYQEGDIVVFSPIKTVRDGMDCFVRLEPDHETTFKRIYFQTDETGQELIRIQPINNKYPSVTVPRERVAGLYAGVSVMRSIV